MLLPPSPSNYPFPLWAGLAKAGPEGQLAPLPRRGPNDHVSPVSQEGRTWSPQSLARRCGQPRTSCKWQETTYTQSLVWTPQDSPFA